MKILIAVLLIIYWILTFTLVISIFGIVGLAMAGVEDDWMQMGTNLTEALK